MGVKVSVPVCVRVSAFVGWRAFESYVMTKGGESVISAFLSACWSDQCVISHPPPSPLPAQQNAHTRAQGHPRRAQKAFSLQLIAARHSPVIKLFTALWPHSTRAHTRTCAHTHAHAHARVCGVCTCRIAAAQWWTAGVGPVKTLESRSRHQHSVRSCFLLSFLSPCPNTRH